MGITINGKSETGIDLMGFKEILRVVATKLPRATELPKLTYLGKSLETDVTTITKAYLQ